MIVKMKKVSIVLFDRFREQSLKALRKLGLVHIESRPASSDELARFAEQNTQLERAWSLLPEETKKERKRKRVRASSAAPAPEEDVDGCVEIAEEVIELTEKIRVVQEKIERLIREQQRLDLWGGYDPKEIRDLADKGVYISLYQLSPDEFKQLPEELYRFVLERTKSYVRLAVVSLGAEPSLEFEAVAIGEQGRAELKQELDGAGKEL